MAYLRVIPRDLFNEGDLLNCLGRLWINLDNWRDHKATLEFSEGSDATPASFNVWQSQADGSISVANVILRIDGRPAHLYRPLNCRSKWPLWLMWSACGDDIRVLDEATGDLTPEFIALVTNER